ncbi:MAG: 4Fe-4S binding protein [Candidatus Abyssubacteria bacterium]
MFIDQKLCKKCLDCKPVCPMGAIVLKGKRVVIDYEMCVECGVCQRFNICPEGAIRQADEIPYPRVIRAVFSDPIQRHESTGVLGRGTEEMKTNDVTNLFTEGKIGFSVELGRPVGGAYLRDLEKVVKKTTKMGVEFARDNPVMSLVVDRTTGALRPEVLNEKVLSAIVEFLVPEERALDVFDEMKQFLNTEVDCIVTMSVIARADSDGNPRFLERLKERGILTYPNGKVNIGMALVQEAT